MAATSSLKMQQEERPIGVSVWGGMRVSRIQCLSIAKSSPESLTGPGELFLGIASLISQSTRWLACAGPLCIPHSAALILPARDGHLIDIHGAVALGDVAVELKVGE